MAVQQLNSATISENLTADTNEFAVSSTANIVAGQLLVLRGEVIDVQKVPVSGRVRVRRGVNGTRARAHASGTRFYIGNPADFKSIRDNAAAVVGDSGFLPDYLLPGSKALDFAGNEYVLVDLQAQVYSGVTVLIDSAHDGTFFAAVLTTGSQGFVGVMAEEGTSNQWGWAQIYGTCNAQEAGGTSAADSTYLPIGATSVSTPAAGMAAVANTSGIANQFLIKGMFITGAASTATTSATSHTGVSVPVTLNYPYVTNIQDTINS